MTRYVRELCRLFPSRATEIRLLHRTIRSLLAAGVCIHDCEDLLQDQVVKLLNGKRIAYGASLAREYVRRRERMVHESI